MERYCSPCNNFAYNPIPSHIKPNQNQNQKPNQYISLYQLQLSTPPKTKTNSKPQLTGLKFGNQSNGTPELASNCGITPNVGNTSNASSPSYTHFNSVACAPTPKLYKITSRSVYSYVVGSGMDVFFAWATRGSLRGLSIGWGRHWNRWLCLILHLRLRLCYRSFR